MNHVFLMETMKIIAISLDKPEWYINIFHSIYAFFRYTNHKVLEKRNKKKQGLKIEDFVDTW